MRLRQNIAASSVALCLAVGVIAVSIQSAVAQSVPGLIVAVPDDDRSSSRPAPQGNQLPSYYGGQQRTRPPAAAPARRARPTKRKPKAKRRAALNRGRTKKRAGTSIVLLVNDDPITEYEISQRARLMALRANIKGRVQAQFKSLISRSSTSQQLRSILQRTIAENRGSPRDVVLKIFEKRKKAFAVSLQRRAIASARASLVPTYRKKAIEDLIAERLKLHEAKRLKVLASKSQVNTAIAGVAKRNKMNRKQFEKHISRLGIDFMTMRERIRTQMSWTRVIRSRFSRMISINQRDIDQVLAGQTDNNDDVKLKLHRITLSLPEQLSQADLAKRLSQAEDLHRRFKGCAATRKLAGTIPGARFEDLGAKPAQTVPEPTRSLLLTASNDQMVPPATTARGIELYAVCSRSAVHGSLKAQARARATLRQKEFNILARRHLMDLKRDAHIERR